MKKDETHGQLKYNW